jgi:hypothetical protein
VEAPTTSGMASRSTESNYRGKLLRVSCSKLKPEPELESGVGRESRADEFWSPASFRTPRRAIPAARSLSSHCSIGRSFKNVPGRHRAPLLPSGPRSPASRRPWPHATVPRAPLLPEERLTSSRRRTGGWESAIAQTVSALSERANHPCVSLLTPAACRQQPRFTPQRRWPKGGWDQPRFRWLVGATCAASDGGGPGPALPLGLPEFAFCCGDGRCGLLDDGQRRTSV